MRNFNQTVPNMHTQALKFILAFLVVFTATHQPARADKKPYTFIINTPVFPPYTSKERDGFEDSLATEMFKRAGIQIDINHVPSERGLVNLNSGIDDGIMSRVRGLEKTYKNTVMIDEDVIEWRFVAFSRDPNIKVSDWKSLAPYNVGIVNGWKILERNIVDAKSLLKVENVKQLFKMLAASRLDVAIYAEQPGRLEVQSLKNGDIHILNPPLATRKKFFYVHKKHTDLAKRLANILADMKRDGTYERIRSQTLATQ